MKYIDTNIFIYAYFNPKNKVLDEKIKWMKEESKKIITQINIADQTQKEFCISVITLAEIVNKLKSNLPLQSIYQILFGLYSNSAIDVAEITPMLYMNAIDKILEYGMDPNDISTLLVMNEKNITEIYSFDAHFRKSKEYHRIT